MAGTATNDDHDPLEPNEDGEFECSCGEIFETVEAIKEHARQVHDKDV
jgi:hypothetical protein